MGEASAAQRLVIQARRRVRGIPGQDGPLSLAAAISLALAQFAPPAAAQQVVPSGHTATSLSVSGNVTDVTTTTRLGNSGLNSFSRFDVHAGNVVNLHLPEGTANLLNVVRDSSTRIDGLLNAIKDGQVGGNLFFANPHGIIVGEQGVINVGSLHLSTPTLEFVDGLFTAPGLADADVAGLLLAGQVPVSASAPISVQGTVNARGDIAIAAGSVVSEGVIQSGAVYGGARVDFADVVNVAGLESAGGLSVSNGSIRILAAGDLDHAGVIRSDGAEGLDGGRVELRAGGDISLRGDALVSASGRGADSAGGSIIVLADRDATLADRATLAANGGEVSGDGGFVEFSARRRVTLAGGSLQADAVDGAGGTVLIDPEDLVIGADLLRNPGGNASGDGVSWSAGSLVLQADNSLTINSGVVVSTRDVGSALRADHVDGPSTGASGNLTLLAGQITVQDDARLLAHGDSGFAGGNVLLAASASGGNLDFSDVAAGIAIGSATIRGADVTLQAEAAYTSGFIPIVVRDVAATIDLDGTQVEAAGALTIGASATLESSTPGLLPAETIDAGVSATVDVHGASLLRSTGGDLGLSASATVSALVEAGLPDLLELPFDAGVAVVLVDSTAGVSVRGTSELDAAGQVSLLASNSVTAGAAVDASASGSNAAGAAAAVGVIEVVTTAGLEGNARVSNAAGLAVEAGSVIDSTISAAAATDGAASQGSDQDGKLQSQGEQVLADYGDQAQTADGGVQVAAAVAVSDISSLTRAWLGSAASSTVGGPVTVASRAATAAEVSADGSAAAGGTGVGVGVAINLAEVTSQAGVAQPLQAAGLEITALLDPAAEGHRFGSSATSGAGATDVGVAGSLAVNVVSVDTAALLASGAEVDAGGGDVLLEAVNDSSSSASATPAEGGATGDTVGVGASVAVNVTRLSTRAELEDGAALEQAGSLAVLASGDYALETGAEAGSAGGVGITPVVAVALADNLTLARLGAGPRLDLAGTLEVAAVHAASSVTTAQAEAAGDSVAIGASVAVNITSDRALATTLRDVGTTGGDLVFTASAAAASSASASASAKGGKEETEGETPEDGVDQEVGRQLALGQGQQQQDSVNQGQQPQSADTGEGKVSVAAAVAVNVAEARAEAWLADQVVAEASGGLYITASGNTDAAASADGSSAGSTAAVGIGAAVAINKVSAITAAWIGDAEVNTSGIELVAGMTDNGDDSQNSFAAEASSGAGGGKVGIAGALALNLIEVRSTATVRTGARVDAGGGDVLLAATSASSASAVAKPDEDGGASGGEVGVGASVAVNTFSADQARAALEQGSSLAGAGNLALVADSSSDTTAEAQAGAEGSVAVDAVVAFSEVKQSSEAVIAPGSPLEVTGTVSLSATASGVHVATATGDVESGKVGVGASAAVITSSTLTRAALERDLVAGSGSGDALLIEASASRSYEAVAFASAAGASDDEQLSEQDKDQAKSTSTLKDTEDSQQGAQGGSKVNVAAAAGILVLDDDVEAVIAPGLEIRARGAIGASAANDANFSARGRGDTLDITKIGNTQVGIGVGVGLAIARNDTLAAIGAGTRIIEAGDITLAAVSTQNTAPGFANKLAAEAVSGAGSDKVSVAGSLAVANSNAMTQALIEDGVIIGQAGQVSISADNTSKLSAKAWSGALSNKVGIGASVATLVSTNSYRAAVGSGADITAGGLSLVARNHKVSGSVPFEFEFSLDGASVDSFEDKFSEQNLQLLLGENNYYTEALAGAGGGQVAVTGSFAVNVFDDTTEATIGADARVEATDAVQLEASNDTTAKAIAGALAAGKNAGVGLNTADIINTSRTLASLGDRARIEQGASVTVEAAATLDFGVFGAALGAANSAGVGGVLALVLADNEVAAVTGTDAFIATAGDATLSASSRYESLMLAGAGAGGSSAGVGASAATNLVETRTRAEVGSGADLRVGGTLDVRAEASEKTTTISVAAGAASTAGVGAGVVVNVIEPLVRAWIGGNARVNVDELDPLVRGERVLVHAGGETELLAIAGGVGAAGTAGGGAGVDVGVVSRRVEAGIAGGAEVRASELISVTTSNREDIFSIGAAGGGAGTVGLAGAAAGHRLSTQASSFIGGGATLHSQGNVVVAADSVTELSVIAGGAAVGGTVGVGIGAAVVVFDKLVEAWIGEEASVTALGAGSAPALVGTGGWDIGYADYDPARSGDEIQGPSGDLFFDAEAVSAGGDLLTRQRSATRATGELRGLAVTATSRDQVKAAGAAGAAAGTVSVTFGGAVGVLDSVVSARIGDRALINPDNSGAHEDQSVLVAAGHDLYHLGLGGSASGAGVVGAGAGADVMIIDLVTEALIGSEASVRVRRDVDVLASARQDLLAIAGAAAAGGTVGVAGAVGALVLDSATSAAIGADAFVDADGNVRVVAGDDTRAIMVAGSLGIGFGAVGVGGSVGVTSISKDTQASVGAGAIVNARGGLLPVDTTDEVVPTPPGLEEVEAIEDDPGIEVDDPQAPPPAPDTADFLVYTGDSFGERTTARGLLVQATSSEDLLAIAAAGSGGLFAGVSGAVTIESIRSVTQAWIGAGALVNQDNERANARQDVNVTARNDAKLLVIDGSLAVGPLGAGVSGSVDVGLIRNDTSAWIGSGAQVAARRDIDINALGRKDIDSIVISAAGGLVGIAAGVGVYSIGTALDNDARGRLDTDNGSANAYADGQLGNGTVTGGLNGFGNDRLAAIGSEAGARRSGLSVSGQLSAAPPSGTSAWVGEGAHLEAGRHIDIDARDSVGVNMIAGAVGGGAIGFGAGVSVALVNTNVQAWIDRDAMLAGALEDPDGDISLTARLDSDSVAASYAGSGGLAAIDAAAAIFNDTSTIAAEVGAGAQLTSARQVRVEAIDRRSQAAEALGAGVGAATAGASVATTRLGGQVRATLGEQVRVGQDVGQGGGVGELIVVADSAATAVADATSARAGLGLAASGSVATSTVNPQVLLSVGEGSTIGTAAATSLSALAAPRAVAIARGINVSAGVSIGASVASATAAPQVRAVVEDDVQFSGGTLSLLAQNRPADGTDSAFAQAIGASGGALVGANATLATARSQAQVRAILGNGVSLPDASAFVRANNYSRQRAIGLGLAAGFVAVGANDVEATSNGLTLAEAGSGLITTPGRLGDFAVVADGLDQNIAESTAGSGGVIAGNASFAETRDLSSVTATLAGGSTLYTGALLVDASHTDQFAPRSDSLNAAAVGASGAFASHFANSTVNALLGSDLVVNAAGPVVVSASNIYTDTGSGERASGAAGGVANGAAVGSATTFAGTANVTLGNGVTINSGTDPVLNPGGIELIAATFLTADEQVSLVSGGALAGALAQTRLTALVGNNVVVGQGNQLLTQGHLGVGTFSQVLATTTSLVNTYGGAAVGSADSTNTITSNQSVTIGGNSLLQGATNVDITAGKDPTGFYETLIAATSSAQGYVRGLIAIPDAEAATRITSNASLNVGQGTLIRSGQNTTLGAYKGTPLASADGTGRGFELGFIPVTQTDSTVNVITSANVVHNGAVTAGIFNRLELEIPNCANSGVFCNTLNVLTTGDVAPFLATFLPVFDPVEFVENNFEGTAAQLLLSGVSGTPVAAWTFGTLFVAGGQVIVNADSLSGSGALTARGGPVISINNRSPAYLVLGPVLIPNTPGGRVVFTGAAGRAQAGGITINEINPGQAPVVDIRNSFNGTVGTPANTYGPALFLTGPVQNLGGLVLIENVRGSLGQVATIFGQQVQVTVPEGVVVISIPDGVYYVSGTPYSQWAGFMIWPGGNPAQGRPDANQAAAWAANFYSVQNLEGNATQFTLNRALYGFAGDTDNNSYVFYGFCAAFSLSQAACSYSTAAGLSPVGQGYAISGSDFNHRWFPVVPVQPLSRTANTWDVASLAGSQQGAAIFGGQVLIQARFIDLNSRIVAGQPTDWSVVLPAALTAGPAGFFAGGPITIHDTLYALGLTGPTLDLANLPLVNPMLDERIRATYDARTSLITLDNVNASSGGARVVIEGEIISTNPFGQILVNGGLGTVNVQNQSGRGLVLQQVNTGNTALASALENRVQITDTGRSAATRQWLYLYSPADGLRVFNGAAGVELGGGTPVFTSNGSSYWFDPRPGLRWEWQLRARMTRQLATDSNGWVSSVSGWNWVAVDPQLDANDPWRYATVNQFNNFTSATTKVPTGRLVMQAGGPVFQQDITATNFDFFRQGVNYHGCGSNNICNYGFRRTGTYTSGSRNGEAFANWGYQMATGATLVMTQSVRADNRIGVDFAGNPRGTINVTSNAPVTLTGQLLNPNGDTSLQVNGSLLAGASGSLLTDNATLQASGSIGSIGQPLPVTLSGGGVLNATAGRDGLFLDINSAVNLGSLVSGDLAGGYGEVVVRAAGSLLRAPGLPAGQANVTGRSITLESTLGSVGLFGSTGHDGIPLLVDARPTLLLTGALAGGEVTVRAQTDVALRQDSGPLLIGSIESTAAGRIFLSAPGGSLLSASGQTAAQALEPEQVRRIWQDLQLTEGFGAPQAGDAAAASVQVFEAQVEREYQRYWQLRSRGSVEQGQFVLDDSALPLYRPIAALVAGIEEPTDAQVRAYAAQLYGEVTGVLVAALGADFELLAPFQAYDEQLVFQYQANPDQVAALTARALWTEAELSAAINRSALQPAAGTPVGIGTPNVIGSLVVLDSGSAIGRLAEPLFVGLADLQSGNLTTQQSAALALAVTPGDVVQVGLDADGNTVTWSFGQQPAGSTLTGFLVSQTSPLFVEVSGGFRANTGGEAFIQSAGQVLTLDQVIAAGNVSLTAPQSIVSAGTSPVQVIAGGDLTLLAGSGSIGASALDPLVIDIGGRLLAASAAQDVYLRAVTGDLVIGRLFAGQRAWLDAAAGSLAGFLDGIVIEAEDFELFASDDIGSAARPFQVWQRGAGELDASAGGSAWLFAPTASLAVGDFTVADGLVLASAFDLAARSLWATNGNVGASAGGDARLDSVTAGGEVRLAATGTLSLGDALAGGEVDVVAGGDVDVDGSVLAGAALAIVAEGSIAVAGQVASTGGSVGLAAGGDLAIGGSAVAEAGTLAASAGGDLLVVGSAAASGDLEMTAGGALALDGQVESVTGAVRLEAGQSAMLGGNVGAGTTATVSAGGAVLVSAGIDAGGDVSVAAGTDLDLLDGGLISSGSGDIQLTAGAALTMGTGSLVEAGSGAITLWARDDAVLGRLVSAGAANVTVTSLAGAIRATSPQPPLLIDAAGALLTLDAALGIGEAGAPLQVRIAGLDAQVRGAGGLWLANQGDLLLERAASADGPVSIATSGELAVRRVQATGDVALRAGVALRDLGEGEAASVSGRAIMLEATAGDIGSGDRAFAIDSGSTSLAPVSASAGGSVWLRETAGDLFAGQVTAAGDVDLRATGALLGAAPGLHVSGGVVTLESAGGTIGSESLALAVDSRTRLDARAASGIWLEEAAGDLRSDFMITQAGSIDLLVRDGSGLFGEVMAPEEVRIVANGSLLSIAVLDPVAVWLSATAPGSTLRVDSAVIGAFGQFNADFIEFPQLLHSGLLEPLLLSASGHAGGLAESASFNISSLPGVIFDPLRVREATVTLAGERLALVDSQVVARGLFTTSRWTVLVDNVNRRLFPVDVQLYSAAVPLMQLAINETPRVDTNALAINYQRYMQVNGFSTENSLTRLVPKLLAIAEDAEGSGEDPEYGTAEAEVAEVEIPPGLPAPVPGALDAAAGARITL